MKTCPQFLKCQCLTLSLLVTLSGTALAQGSRRNAVQSTKSLDSAAEKAQNDYLSSLAELANKYEEAGDLEKASDMLKGILKIKPDADLIKNKLKMFEEAVFRDNVQTLEIDSGAGWINTGILLAKDKPVRIEADGSYKVTTSDVLGPAGHSSDDLIHGMAGGVPFGGLMAVIGKSGSKSKGKRKNNKDLPRPIYIGTHKELTPKAGGPLLLKVNVPETARCVGKIKIKITGNFAQLGR